MTSRKHQPKIHDPKAERGGGKPGVGLEPTRSPGEDRFRLKMIGDEPDDSGGGQERRGQEERDFLANLVVPDHEPAPSTIESARKVWT